MLRAIATTSTASPYRRAPFTPAEVADIREHAERVLAGVYETGVATRNNSGGPDVANHPSYIEAQMPQDADNVIGAAPAEDRVVGGGDLRRQTAQGLVGHDPQEVSDT